MTDGKIKIEDRDRELVGEYVGNSPAGVWRPRNVDDLAAFAAWLRRKKERETND